MYPEELYYTKEHEWLREEGGEGTMGITSYAQEALGDLVYVELPTVGDEVEMAQECATVESVKAVSELYAPISGVILAVNELLLDQPEKVNSDPYGEGWIARIKIRDPEEVKTLLSAEAYAAYIETEVAQ